MLASLAMIGAGLAGETANSHSISAKDFRLYSAGEFHQADRDGSGGLSDDEFASLELVKAELVNLNGFVRFREGVAIPVANRNEGRVRIDRDQIIAAARLNFEWITFPDKEMSMRQFQDLRNRNFRAADLSHDGTIEEGEIDRLVSISLNYALMPTDADNLLC